MDKELSYIFDLQKEAYLLNYIYALLDWDARTNMPVKGISSRADELEYIQSSYHAILTDKKLVKSLKRWKDKKLCRKRKIILREFWKVVDRENKIPSELVEKLAKREAIASSVWEEARRKNDFSIFAPELEKLVELKRKQAKYLNPKVDPYDALLNVYEEGMNSERLSELFSYLKEELVSLLNDIRSTKKFKKQKPLKLKLDEKVQEEISRELIKKMDIVDFDRFNMSRSAHPFTTRIGIDDVRITNRYLDLFSALSGAIHEMGHALYELGMDKKYAYTFVFDSPSMGLHESQSRFWENMIFRGRPFWKAYSKIVNKKIGKKFSIDDYYHTVNLVKPSYIRVEADEVTYPLHIILRFEIERDLINGKLKVSEAKKAWNKRFKELFGFEPKNDNQGILQDVHWSMGDFGYFPTYAIGTIYAAQIYNKMKKEIDVDKLVESFNFKPIAEWLRKKIHSKGKEYLADELIKKVCGKGLDPKEYISYLREKYKYIYGF